MMRSFPHRPSPPGRPPHSPSRAPPTNNERRRGALRGMSRPRRRSAHVITREAENRSRLINADSPPPVRRAVPKRLVSKSNACCIALWRKRDDRSPKAGFDAAEQAGTAMDSGGDDRAWAVRLGGERDNPRGVTRDRQGHNRERLSAGVRVYCRSAFPPRECVAAVLRREPRRDGGAGVGLPRSVLAGGGGRA